MGQRLERATHSVNQCPTLSRPSPLFLTLVWHHSKAGGRAFEVNTVMLENGGGAGGLSAGPAAKTCEVRLGVNPTTLAHLARTTLSAGMNVSQRKLTSPSEFKMDFRLVDEVKEQGLDLNTAREEHEAMTFSILSNKNDPEADLPPHWNPKFALRPEQVRGEPATTTNTYRFHGSNSTPHLAIPHPSTDRHHPHRGAA